MARFEIDAKTLVRRAFAERGKALGYIAIFKSHAPIGEVQNLAKVVSNTAHPFHKYVCGRLKAASYAELRWNRDVYVTDSLIRELIWAAAAIGLYSDEINAFMRRKRQFEECLLLSDFPKAKLVLDSIEAASGVSLWLLNARIALEELSGGLEANAKFVSDFVSREGIPSHLKTIAQFFGMRSESSLSCENYSLKLAKYLGIYEDKNIEAYLRFRLSADGRVPEEGEVVIGNILAFDQHLPVVDRFFSFLKLCQYSWTVEVQRLMEVFAV